MQIYSIKNVERRPAFKAHLVLRSSAISSFVNLMNKTPENAKLMQGVIDAFKKYPSNLKVKASIINSPGFWGARGVIETKYAKLIDVEPANQNRTHPIKNILRRILDPENKEKFNQLMGGKQDDIYDAWWAENISPIWDDINSTFREKTFFNGNYDREFNKDYAKQNEKTWQKILASEVEL
jgi:hypothetical protein